MEDVKAVLNKDTFQFIQIVAHDVFLGEREETLFLCLEHKFFIHNVVSSFATTLKKVRFISF